MSARGLLIRCLCLVLLLVPASASAWTLEVKRVQYNGVELILDAIARSGEDQFPAWIGLTACDSDKEFDDEGFLAVFDFKAEKVTGPRTSTSVYFKAKVGPNVDGYILAAWRKKVAKCQRDRRRPGCKKWGYVLDGELTSIPGDVYWMYPSGEKFKAGQAFWEVRMMAAGADEQDLAKVRSLVEKYAKGKRRGGEAKLAYKVADGPKAKNPRKLIQVMYRYKDDEADADALARALLDLGKVEVKHWAGAPAPLIVAVPKL